MRPLRPEDAALYPEFIAHVTREDLRLRFFAAIRSCPSSASAELTRLDYTRAMAFIAIDEADGACSASCGCIATRRPRAANMP